MTVSVLCLFLTVLQVGLQCVIEAFPGHNHLPFVQLSCRIGVAFPKQSGRLVFQKLWFIINEMFDRWTTTTHKTVGSLPNYLIFRHILTRPTL